MANPAILFPASTGEFKNTEAIVRAKSFPQLRYMGSKHRLLPWIGEALSGLSFQSALDAFSGSGSVAYLLKSMGKRVVANDFLNFPYQIGMATTHGHACDTARAPRGAGHLMADQAGTRLPITGELGPIRLPGPRGGIAIEQWVADA